MWDADLTGGVALVFGAEGKGVRPLVRKTCDAAIAIPLADGVESLNVSVAAAVLLYEARRQRSSRPETHEARRADLYLFDGYNLLHAGGRRDVRELVDELASFVAVKGARGYLVFDGIGEDRQVGSLTVRYAPDADTLLERLAAEHRHRRACLPRLLRHGRARHVRAGGGEGGLEHVPRGARRRPRTSRSGVAPARPARPRDAGEARAAAAQASRGAPSSQAERPQPGEHMF